LGPGRRCGGDECEQLVKCWPLSVVPTFDPSLFAGRIPADIWKGYLEDKRHPLENKALSGQYPPGSTFKMLTALAGLEAGVIDENTSVFVILVTMKWGDSKFRCWSKSGHGSVNLRNH
jgi:penicillin-binding protein 2